LAGTERCQEALHKLKKKYDIVVNIQGDEPLIDPDVIDGVTEALQVNFLLFFTIS
jgi:3-deoxy-manno-octulosonate cytidylyltransferase (CMP-KDO synthetase)